MLSDTCILAVGLDGDGEGLAGPLVDRGAEVLEARTGEGGIELLRIVNHLADRAEKEAEIREYISKTVKQATLERIKDSSELERSEEFEELKADVVEAGSGVGDVSESMSPEEFDDLLKSIIDRVRGEDG